MRNGEVVIAMCVCGTSNIDTLSPPKLPYVMEEEEGKEELEEEEDESDSPG